MTSITLYEVVRVIEGVPLFLEDHLFRLEKSAYLTNLSLPETIERIESRLIRFIAESNRQLGNIKISCSLTQNDALPHIAFEYLEHHYPEEKEYLEGVRCSLLWAERTNPNAKVINESLRERANRLIKENDLFEVILVDSNNHVTEGSRSNLFFVQKNKLVSAPREEILHGITWLKIMELCKRENIPVHERPILANTIKEYDAAFLTGTSPKILPIRRIDAITYRKDHPMVNHLIQCYDDLIQDYISSKRRT